MLRLCRAFPPLPIAVDGKVIKITEKTDVTEVFAPLFAPKAKKKSKAPKQEPAKKGKAKQQKSKKRKST
jgi:hypothetical protein